MTPDEATARLPAAYGTALRMWATGATTAEIATALEVEPEAVPTLLDLARAKQRRLAGDAPVV